MGESKIGMVYFDIGNVLARHQGGLNTLSDMFGAGLHEITKELQVLSKQGNRGKIATQDIWEGLKTTFRYEGKDIDFLNFWCGFLQPIAKTHDFLNEISKITAIGLLTNLFPGMYEVLLKRGDIPDAHYLASVVSCQVKVAKPDQGIFKIAENRVGIPPSKILFIDDNAENIAVAKKRHWQTVQFNPEDPTDSIHKAREKIGYKS